MKRNFFRSRIGRFVPWLAVPLLLWWLLGRIPFSEVGQILVSINSWKLVLLVLFNILAMIFFASRWWVVIHELGCNVNYFSLLRYRMAGFTISYFTPGTQFGGEPLQIYALKSRHKLAPSLAAASVTLDKLFEVFSNFTFLAFGIVVITFSRLFVDISRVTTLIWVGGILLLPVAYLIFLALGHLPLSSLLTRIKLGLPSKFTSKQDNWFDRVTRFSCSTEEQVRYFLRNHPSALLKILIASGLIWVFSLTEYWLALFVLGAQVNIIQAIAALTAARLAFLVPLPGGIGALEASQVYALQALGFDPAYGLAISLWIRSRDGILGLIGVIAGAGFWKSMRVDSMPPATVEK